MNEVKEKNSLFKEFLSYAIPCIVGMILTSSITVIDGIFIGRKLGENGLAAVNLTLPFLYLLLAVTIMIAVGGVTVASQNYGAKNMEQAKKYFTITVVLNLIVNLIIIGLAALFLDKLILALNAKGVLFGMVRDFLSIMIFFYIFMMLNMTLSMFIRSEGKPQLSLLFIIVSNVLNIVLDYLLIFKFNLGMKGAAIASGTSVLIAFLMGVSYFLSKKSVYKFVKIKIAKNDLMSITINGMAEFIGQISISVTTFLFNLIIIKRIGVEGIAAFTVIGYVSFLQSMVITGIMQGVHPLMSYNYGAKNREKVIELLSIGIKSASVVGVLAFLVSFFASDSIVWLFSKNTGPFAEIASGGLKIFAISYILNGFNMIASVYFVSTGKGKLAAFISVFRSLILVSVFIVVLPVLIGNIGIWLAVPLTEVIILFMAYFYLKKAKQGLLISAAPEIAL